MIFTELNNFRIEISKKYVNHLSVSFIVGWEKCRKSLETEKDTYELILKKLALLHPEHYYLILKTETSRINSKIELIQGNRSFPQIDDTEKCQSEELWGYICPFTIENKVQDHEFPYSLGGPTNKAFNRRILCRWHNMIKANDIHNYPWEKLFNQYEYYIKTNRVHWVDEQLNKIIKEFNL